MPKWIRTRCSADSNSENCVEVAEMATGEVIVRSSLNTARDVELTRGEWDTFLAGAKAGEFDEL